MIRHHSLFISFLRPAIGLVLCACVAGCQPGNSAAAAGAVRIVPQPPGNQAAAPATSLMPDSRFDSGALRPRIPIDPADTLLQVVNMSVDKDAEEEQVIAIKRTDDVESPVRLIVADADPRLIQTDASRADRLNPLPVPLLPFIRDNFSLDYASSGLLISVFSITYGISQLPSGWLADRVGTRILMAIGICGVGLCGILIGLSNSYVMLLVLLGFMGVN